MSLSLVGLLLGTKWCPAWRRIPSKWSYKRLRDATRPRLLLVAYVANTLCVKLCETNILSCFFFSGGSHLKFQDWLWGSNEHFVMAINNLLPSQNVRWTLIESLPSHNNKYNYYIYCYGLVETLDLFCKNRSSSCYSDLYMISLYLSMKNISLNCHYCAFQ